MKFCFLAVFLLFSVSLFAQETSSVQPKHIVSVGTDGLGWSAKGEVFDLNKSRAGIKDKKEAETSFHLSYSFIFDNRVMLGADLELDTESEEIKYTNGRKIDTRHSSSSAAITLGYNFNEDIFRSWWIKGGLGGGSTRTEIKDSTAASKFKTTGGLSFFRIEGGKRFSFESWGLKNFSYSPSIALTWHSYNGDIRDDQGIEHSSSLTLNIFKFDIIF